MHRWLRISLVISFTGCFAPSPETACDELARAQCAKLDECRLEGVAQTFGDLGTCIARRSDQCLSALSSPDTGVSPAFQEHCAHAMAAQSCLDFLENRPVPACITPTGARAIGDPCAFNSECDTAFCAIASDAACGSCAPQPQVGDECADQGCGYALSCNANKTCAEWVAAGGACDADQPCAPHTWCVTPAGSATGTCMPSGTTVGAPCDPHKQTAAGCDFNLGLFCSTTTSTCTAINYVDAGAACGVIDGDSNVCLGGASCRGKPAMCIAPAFDGDPCDTAVGPGCMAPARCATDGVSSAGTCSPPDQSVCTPDDPVNP